jgi:hypothetical protein
MISEDEAKKAINDFFIEQKKTDDNRAKREEERKAKENKFAEEFYKHCQQIITPTIKSMIDEIKKHGTYISIIPKEPTDINKMSIPLEIEVKPATPIRTHPIPSLLIKANLSTTNVTIHQVNNSNPQKREYELKDITEGFIREEILKLLKVTAI